MPVCRHNVGFWRAKRLLRQVDFAQNVNRHAKETAQAKFLLQWRKVVFCNRSAKQLSKNAPRCGNNFKLASLCKAKFHAKNTKFGAKRFGARAKPNGCT